MVTRKLGFTAFTGEDDLSLVAELHELLQLVETDMTIFYRRLADLDLADAANLAGAGAVLADAYYVPAQRDGDYERRLHAWLERYQARSALDRVDQSERRRRMNAVNPKYVLRNYLAQLAIDNAEAGDYALVNELLAVLRRPYDEQPEHEQHAARRPDWARERAGCSMLSCSS
jgi:uncharacterized protein YdiU (UPF0061 family)